MRYLTTVNFEFAVQARLSAESIIAGTESRPHEFPYVISLQSNGTHFCGGGIINEQFILTAAHCFIDEEDNFRDGEFEVVAGTNNLKEDSDTKVKVRVAAAYSSALYNGGSENHVGDIAVLKVKTNYLANEYNQQGSLDQSLALKWQNNNFWQFRTGIQIYSEIIEFYIIFFFAVEREVEP